jgi:hypothetical protein
MSPGARKVMDFYKYFIRTGFVIASLSDSRNRKSFELL